MAIEDAAALGILFNKDYFTGNIKESLAVYEKVRLPRATKVQASAAKAAYNINERIGKYLCHLNKRGTNTDNHENRLLKQYLILQLQSRGRVEEAYYRRDEWI